MEPWYKVATPRKEVREGRSFNPDEFAIALEQVVAGTAPADYADPTQFFSRTCFTTALTDHVGMVLRRLSGQTQNAAPVMALITQFGGGKTHTLATLYHLVKNSKAAAKDEHVKQVLKQVGISTIPSSRVAVFVGNAWDPSPGCETPWIDIARQLAGDDGVAALGPEAKKKAPGTSNLSKLFEKSGGHVLILCDEVLNFLSRHRDRAEAFRDFLANLVRATTGTSGCAAMLSLPQSKPEMTDWDQKWQTMIAKEVGRVAKQLIANDEAEISDVVRRRLFQELGNERARNAVAKTYADWCFERRNQLPSEWTAVDTASTEAKAKDLLRSRFENCYPFHPATISVFQRKWQTLPQYQQTRGTLAMFAQWISLVSRRQFQEARGEALISLGSAPLDSNEFRSVILGQLGEPKLSPAIEADIAGVNSKARALDADSKEQLRDIHRKVATAILFESSGGQTDKVAHLPELRFALGQPGLDTTSIDNAAHSLERKALYIRKVGTDGFRIGHKPTPKKVKNDRQASLDEEKDVRPAMKKLVEQEFRKGAAVPLTLFPADAGDIADSPKLTLVVLPPGMDWDEDGATRKQVAQWTKQRGSSSRLYPGALVWCIKKPGRDLFGHTEELLAWRRVDKERIEGLLGDDFDRSDCAEIQASAQEAEEDAREEVWASYRFIAIADATRKDGIREIDLGAGHASGSATLCGRIIGALKSEAVLNESVGASYIDSKWPPAFKESGAWPLLSLRQSFVNGTLTRLLDPETVLRGKIVEFVGRGDFGLAYGQKSDSTYERVWFSELISADDVRFDADVFLLKKAKAKELKGGEKAEKPAEIEPPTEPEPPSEGVTPKGGLFPPGKETVRLRLAGSIPPELWNRFGTKVLPKLRQSGDVTLQVDCLFTVEGKMAAHTESDLRQVLRDLGLENQIKIRPEE